MNFWDAQAQALDLTSSADVQTLVEVHLCGRPSKAELAETDRQLLMDFVEKARKAGVTFEQFNELLLVLNQDRVSRAFFDFFFEPDKNHAPRTFEQLRNGVIRFRGFAMVCFGNFRFAFRQWSIITDREELRGKLGPCCRKPADVEAAYEDRPSKVLDTKLIERDHTWFVGEITGTQKVKYIHGNIGRGTFTFFAGHDPEDYQHLVGDPQTQLSLHRNSPGYRLILNNILFPAARKQKRKT